MTLSQLNLSPFKIFCYAVVIPSLIGVVSCATLTHLTGPRPESLTTSSACEKNPNKLPQTFGIFSNPKPGEVGLLAIRNSPDGVCFRKGQALGFKFVSQRVTTPEIHSGDFHIPPKDVLQRLEAHGGSGVIEGIYPINQKFFSLSKEEISRGLELPDFQSYEDILNYIRIEELPATAAIVKVRVLTSSQLQYNRLRPFIQELMHGMLAIDGSQRPSWAGPKPPLLSEFLSKGGVLIDVRSPEEFKSGHHPAAKNVPYTLPKPVDFFDTMAFMPMIGTGKNSEKEPSESFDLSQLPKNKETPLAFTGTSLTDARIAKAQTLARLAGWSHAVQVYGGELAATGLPYSTPDNLENFCSISPEDLAKSLPQNHVVLVDARSEEEFNIRHINGARPIGTPSFAKMSKKDQTRARTLLTYIGQWNKSDLDFLTSKLNLTNFPKDKTNFVIFHGDDHFDWRGLNYARLAKQSGWEHACWFRGGLAAFPTGRQ